MLFFIGIALLLFGCQDQRETLNQDAFHAKVFISLSTTTHIVRFNTSPLFIEYENIQGNSLSTTKSCLKLLTFGGKKELNLFHIPLDQGCSKNSNPEKLSVLQHIRQFKVHLKPPNTIFFEGYVKNPEKLRGQTLNWSIPLHNLSLNNNLSKPGLKILSYQHSSKKP